MEHVFSIIISLQNLYSKYCLKCRAGHLPHHLKTTSPSTEGGKNVNSLHVLISFCLKWHLNLECLFYIQNRFQPCFEKFRTWRYIYMYIEKIGIDMFKNRPINRSVSFSPQSCHCQVSSSSTDGFFSKCLQKCCMSQKTSYFKLTKLHR